MTSTTVSIPYLFLFIHVFSDVVWRKKKEQIIMPKFGPYQLLFVET